MSYPPGTTGRGGSREYCQGSFVRLMRSRILQREGCGRTITTNLTQLSLMTNLNEQFDVLSNALRLLPEELFRLNYFINEIHEAEEGISNIEVACISVFNNIYGIMCALKEEGACASIYEHDAVTTILCIRHVLQHQTGRLKNNLRDAWSKKVAGSYALIKYSASDPEVLDQPFFINVSWFQDAISKSNNARKLQCINSFWKFEVIKEKLEGLPEMKWEVVYVCATSLLTEAVRVIVKEYGGFISAAGCDSRVYLEHFKNIKPIDPEDFKIFSGSSEFSSP